MTSGEMVTLDANRTEDGKFAVGNTIGVGKPSNRRQTWQPYGERLKRWLNMPLEELHRYLMSPSLMRKLSTIDYSCLVHARNMIKGEDIGWERERALNRIEGKVKDTLVIETPNAHVIAAQGATPTVEEAARMYNDALKRAIAPPDEATGDNNPDA